LLKKQAGVLDARESQYPVFGFVLKDGESMFMTRNIHQML